MIVFNVQRRARETQTAAEAAPRSGRFVQTGDVRIFVQEAGPADAPAVLLVHGTGTWSEIWRETIDALAVDHRVIAVDLPPFGYSDKPLHAGAYTREAQARRIIHLLDQMGIERVTLVAHSVGARPSVEAALEAPQRIARLILIDPALGFESKPPSAAMRTFFNTPSLRTSVISAYGTNPLFLRQMFRSFVSNKAAVTDRRLAVIRQPMAIRNTTAAYGAWLSILMTADDRWDFRRLTMPVGIIWGRTDTVTPLWQGERLHALIPHSRLVVLEGAGHIPYIEDPPRFTAALRALLWSGGL
ncbi:MAG TPA: alpha/beta fold hydrolase [Thermoanaerobaculia bacterium]|nr:alpha/beta fold hydrolase [Thermoanaerobaculia bacterium]